MSDDNVARFMRQHATTAKARCPDVPTRVHPHMLRHSRAMHLYRAGMPLALLTEWLGHTTLRVGSGGPGDLHPRAPTERSVTVSRHSALLIAIRRP